MRPEEKVELAVAISPPAAFRVKTVEVPDWLMLVRVRASPVWFVKALRFRRLAVVEVAATVRTERTSAEVVPTARLSVRVCNRTRVPSSWNPERLRVPAWQMMLPDESVVKALEPEQVGRVVTRSPPARTSSPLNVLVAVLV